MARMYPRTLLEDDVKSEGEVKVFRALESQLDDEWDAYHSVGWVHRDHAEGARDGEVDFVLCHPACGIVCLEVKGGDIECQYGEWRRLIDGEMRRVKDPFGQALDHRYALERKIDAVSGWRGRDLFIVHAVAMPDVPVHSLVFAPDAPPELVIDWRAIEDVNAAIDRVLAFHRGARDKRQPPGDDGATMLRDLLAPHVSIRVPMAERFLAEDEQLVALTREQSMLLTRMHRNPRMAIYGFAGSGKTMLAVEHAKRLASGGLEVLFVCFNKALAAHLATVEPHDRIHFTTFHRLCVRLAHRARIELPDYPPDATTQEFFLDELPEALVQAVEVLGEQYDALIVDEAQDLHDHWLTALRMTLRDEAHAPVWLFLDDNQRVYDARLTVPSDFVHWELTTNCRNTRAIHRQLLELYEGTIVPDVRGPEGRPPELLHTADQPAKVGEVLDRLQRAEDICSRDIVVLSSHGWDKSDVGAKHAARLVRERGKRGDGVLFSSIRAFKGLESPVVVLCELEDLDGASRDQQLYVGLSRARNHCVIVAPPAA
jgi:hypothetical protein